MSKKIALTVIAVMNILACTSVFSLSPDLKLNDLASLQLKEKSERMFEPEKTGELDSINMGLTPTWTARHSGNITAHPEVYPEGSMKGGFMEHRKLMNEQREIAMHVAQNR